MFSTIYSMKVSFVFCLIVLSYWFQESIVYAQGCSDAGFCTIHSVKPSLEKENSRKYRFKTGVTYGIAQYNVSVINPYMEYTQNIGNLSLNAKLSYGIRSGSLANVADLSDLIISGSWTSAKWWHLTGGVKVPLNNADKKENGQSLPMAYQTSLGTTDIIIATGVTQNKVSINVAWQQPLVQNGNSFLPDSNPDDPMQEDYISTNGYIRKGDVLLRLSHLMNLSDKLRLSSSLLPIYHLGNDRYSDMNGQQQIIEGSKGLTLNINAYIQFQLANSDYIELNIGGPVIAREVRPDGLSQFAIALEYGF